jgi:hypothetical protein
VPLKGRVTNPSPVRKDSASDVIVDATVIVADRVVNVNANVVVVDPYVIATAGWDGRSTDRVELRCDTVE